MGIDPTPPSEASGPIATLAHEARRESVLCTVWQHRRALTLERLAELLQGSRYAEDIGAVTVGDLIDIAATRGEYRDRLMRAFLRKFEDHPERRLTSHYFVRYFGVPSWTAQNVLGVMVERRLLRREGKTSDTRYWLARRDSGAA